ncbi:hypothetical protein PHMEG_00036799 [Phytophthora megakarya]|uniref:DUF659 domain-containing protein n=1 Tax=Phytophthora megakarya TaxID=4795 RepID=A0A225UL77_9STRA|nr:hypothetical protein PHMEG_00036799 [Phytophthora megakarya]
MVQFKTGKLHQLHTRGAENATIALDMQSDWRGHKKRSLHGQHDRGDNASAMKSAWSILQNMCPGLMATGCTAHTLGLVMKDVLCDPDLAQVLAHFQEVANFIRNHTPTNARFGEAIRSPDNIDNHRRLKIPVATRWYSHYECVKLVVESERIIRELALDDALLAKYNTAKVTSFKRIVISEIFWLKGDVALKSLSPIHQVLAHLEKDSLCLSVVYQPFVALQQNSSTFCQRIQARWEFIDSSPMRIAYLLDHRRDTKLFTTNQQNVTVRDLEMGNQAQLLRRFADNVVGMDWRQGLSHSFDNCLTNFHHSCVFSCGRTIVECIQVRTLVAAQPIDQQTLDQAGVCLFKPRFEEYGLEARISFDNCSTN